MWCIKLLDCFFFLANIYGPVTCSLEQGGIMDIDTRFSSSFDNQQALPVFQLCGSASMTRTATPASRKRARSLHALRKAHASLQMPFAKIYVVRHGETESNKESVIQGQLDTELNETGVEQARRLADALRLVHFDAAYSSDLVRALKTAQIILEHRPNIEIRREEDLRERFLGDLQGTKIGETIQARMALGVGNETVERAEVFSARAIGWWKKAILQRTRALPPRETPYNILVTSHGGWIMALVRTLIGSRKAQCAPGVEVTMSLNTSVSIIDVELGDEPATIVQFGHVAHLGQELAEMVPTNADEALVDASGVAK
ncbi:histidine phosphatase superfamily [Mycena haematopus]|nr:histidine phosphatase superfamily [Mycena haematopus]